MLQSHSGNRYDGENEVSDSFTSKDIRHVMESHRPGNEGYCLCAWAVGANHDQEFTVDHLLDELEKAK